ncbi:MAG TPA: hypothetical protein DCZ63_05895 [Geobacter sp.]|nr:hypothetical protein [Geobacter sp.]
MTGINIASYRTKLTGLFRQQNIGEQLKQSSGFEKFIEMIQPFVMQKKKTAAEEKKTAEARAYGEQRTKEAREYEEQVTRGSEQRAENRRSDQSLDQAALEGENRKLLGQVHDQRDALVDQFWQAQTSAERRPIMGRIRSLDARAENLGGKAIGDQILKDVSAFEEKTPTPAGEKAPVVKPSAQRFIDMLDQWGAEQGRTPQEKFAASGLAAAAETNGLTVQEVNDILALVQPPEAEAAPGGIQSGDLLSPEAGKQAAGTMEKLTQRSQLSDFEAASDTTGAVTLGMGATQLPVSVPESLIPEGATTTKEGSAMMNEYYAELKKKKMLWDAEGNKKRSDNNISDPIVRSNIFRAVERRFKPKAVDAIVSGDSSSEDWMNEPAEDSVSVLSPELKTEMDRPSEDRLRSAVEGIRNSGFTAQDVQANRGMWTIRLGQLGLTVDEIIKELEAGVTTPVQVP